MSDPATTPTTTTPPAPPAVVTPPAAEPQTFSLEYVRELRAENKGYRLKAQESEQQKAAALKAADDAKAEAEGRITVAQKAANERIIRAELKAAAIKAGMHDTDGLKLADLSKVTLNEAGEVIGADEMLTALKAAKPYLFATPGTPAAPVTPPGSTSSTATPPTPGATQTKHVRDMTPAEREAGRRALTSGARR